MPKKNDPKRRFYIEAAKRKKWRETATFEDAAKAFSDPKMRSKKGFMNDYAFVVDRAVTEMNRK